ncbi:hypothetical protein [Listeria costaricensis]|uniref:hypothetical protein n=1 Tax=Listeria costaricensis TaxID=2026604 RepID=UPI000C08081A|nr:hypothetical protein [Listeria costaricensis]
MKTKYLFIILMGCILSTTLFVVFKNPAPETEKTQISPETVQNLFSEKNIDIQPANIHVEGDQLEIIIPFSLSPILTRQLYAMEEIDVKLAVPKEIAQYSSLKDSTLLLSDNKYYTLSNNQRVCVFNLPLKKELDPKKVAASIAQSSPQFDLTFIQAGQDITVAHFSDIDGKIATKKS